MEEESHVGELSRLLQQARISQVNRVVRHYLGRVDGLVGVHLDSWQAEGRVRAEELVVFARSTFQLVDRAVLDGSVRNPLELLQLLLRIKLLFLGRLEEETSQVETLVEVFVGADSPGLNGLLLIIFIHLKLLP